MFFKSAVAPFSESLLKSSLHWWPSSYTRHWPGQQVDLIGFRAWGLGMKEKCLGFNIHFFVFDLLFLYYPASTIILYIYRYMYIHICIVITLNNITIVRLAYILLLRIIVAGMMMIIVNIPSALCFKWNL